MEARALEPKEPSVRHLTAHACAALLVIGLLTGCGAAATGPETQAGTEAASAGAVAPTDEAATVAMLAAHHRQGMRISEFAAVRASDPEIRELALDIWDTERSSRAALLAWLEERDADVGGIGTPPGALTPEQMHELTSTSGPAFDPLFLEHMIAHHRLALEMAQQVDDALAHRAVTELGEQLQRMECRRDGC